MVEDIASSEHFPSDPRLSNVATKNRTCMFSYEPVSSKLTRMTYFAALDFGGFLSGLQYESTAVSLLNDHVAMRRLFCKVSERAL